MSDNNPVVEAVEDVAEAAQDAAEAVTEPITETVDVVEESAVDTISELSNAFHLQSERMDAQQSALGRIEGNVVDIMNRINETLSTVAAASVETAADVAEAAAVIPEAAAETVEATVESVSEPPKSSRRRKLGRGRSRR